MRFAVVTLLVFVCVEFVLSSPAVPTVPPKCSGVCPQIYAPICGKAKNGGKERLLTFGSDCVMSSYNCDHPNDPYERKSEGECGGKVSVRLQ